MSMQERYAAARKAMRATNSLSETLAASDEILLSDAAVKRAAEAVHYAQGFDDYGVANDEERAEAEQIARAALRAAMEVPE